MKEFENAVAAATAELVASGELTKIVRKTIEATVGSIVREALSIYSPWGKQLAEALAAGLQIDASQIGINGYNQTVLAIVRDRLDHAINVVGAKKVQEDLDQMLGTAAPQEMKLSTLIEQFREHCAKYDRRRCTIILEPPDGGILRSRWLYLGEEPGQDKYRCAIRILISEDGAVHICQLDGVDPKKGIFLGVLYGFKRTIFQLYAAGAKLIIDQEEFNTELDEV